MCHPCKTTCRSLSGIKHRWQTATFERISFQNTVHVFVILCTSSRGCVGKQWQAFDNPSASGQHGDANKAYRHVQTLFVQGRNLYLAGLLLVGRLNSMSYVLSIFETFC